MSTTPNARRSTPRLRATRAVSMLAVAVSGCASPTAQQAATPAPIASVPVATPPPLAWWAPGGGRTAVALEEPEGALVLVGGRRAFVGADGRIATEKAASPEPLVEVIRVPRADGGRVLVGRSGSTVYRFDNPLGPSFALARSGDALLRLGALPAGVVTWRYGAMMGDVATSLDGGHTDAATIVDVESGRRRDPPALPTLPFDEVTFFDAQRGAASFRLAGVATTRDGGATWTHAATEHARTRADVQRAVRRALVGEDVTPSARIEESPMVRWIRRSNRDPLALAVTSGISAGPASALIAERGLVARVDTTTGLVAEVFDIAPDREVERCSIARAPDTAFVACQIGPERAPDGAKRGASELQLAPFPLAGKPGSAWSPQLRLGESGRLRGSTSGGVALLVEAFGAEDLGTAFVRAPGGAWTRIAIGKEHREAAPLRDGRLAYVRRAASEAERPCVVLASETSEERLAPLPLPPEAFEKDGSLVVDGAIDEDDAGRLHFVARSFKGGVFVVSQPRIGPASVRKLEGAYRAIVRAAHGIAIGPRGVDVSDDWGATWQPTEAPEIVRASVAEWGPVEDSVPDIAASEVGSSVDTTAADYDRIYKIDHVRVGWGASRPLPPQAPVDATPKTGDAAPDGARLPRITCHALPGRRGPPMKIATRADARALLAPIDPRRHDRATLFGRHRDFPLGAAAALDVDVADQGAEQARWTLRWIDPLELGAKVRHISGAGPAVPGATSTLDVWASGPNALFVVRGGRDRAVRRVVARPDGRGIEVAAIDEAWVPENAIDVAFGDDGRTIAWRAHAGLVLWPRGEAPRPIADLHEGRVGNVSAAGVPVLAAGVTRVLPATASTAGGAAPPVPIEGWLRAPREASTSGPRACRADDRGPRFPLSGWITQVKIDGVSRRPDDMHYDFALGAERCASKVAITLSEPSKPEPGAPPSPTPPLVLVRADLAAGVAEGGYRTKEGVVFGKMACEIDTSAAE